jgi:hypothetical protein
LALPASDFFRGLLYFYGLQLNHLNPNSIAHVAIFVHLCEAFLGIEPHFALFRYLFRVKPQPSLENQNVVGGVKFQLKQKMDEKYIKYKFPTSHLGWKDLWFYIRNHKPSLIERTGGVPKPQPEWNQNPPASEMEQVNELLELIQTLKLMGVTGASMMYSFFEPAFFNRKDMVV